MMPEVSIIIPVYNAERWLRRCVDSILAQIYTDFELLLIDDGSTDRSGAICDEYTEKDSRIRVFHKLNGGVSSTRNLGIDYACGKWITFCDADDYVMPDWLANYNLSFNYSQDLICQGAIIQHENSQELTGVDKQQYFVDNIGDLASILLKKSILGFVWNKLYRKNILAPQDSNSLKFNPELAFMEDEDFNLRYLLRCKKGIITEKAAYCYIIPANDKHEMFSAKHIPLYRHFISLAREISLRKGSDIEMKYQHLLTASMINLCGQQHFGRKSLKQFRNYIIEEFHNCPLFWLTKTIIAADVTGFLSRIALSIHLQLKYHG